MKFVLNDGLTETAPPRPYDPSMLFGPIQSEINRTVVGANWRALHVEQASVVRAPSLANVENVQKGYLGILSRSYSLHQRITLHPHDVWFLVLSEITDVVAQNVEACRPIFTKSPDKIEIAVPTNDPDLIDLREVELELRKLVPVDLGVFLPEFSTMTPQARYACLAAFCDSASHYYDYMTFLCGIPEIKIEGTRDDWAAIQTHAILLNNLLSGVGLESTVGEWLNRVCSTVDRILLALDTGDSEHLATILTQSRVGSGSQLAINGWFVDFYRAKLRGTQMEGFPNSWCRVPYKNLDTGRQFVGIHGCLLSRRDEEGFVYGDYAEVIVERTPTGKVLPSPDSSGQILRPTEITVTTIRTEPRAETRVLKWTYEGSQDTQADHGGDLLKQDNDEA